MTDDSGSAGSAPAEERLAALDLIRGVAVLGILAVNIACFAGPPAAAYTPRAILPPDAASDWLYAAVLVLFEGKMRALFSMLFGASMVLFVERAEDRGRDGPLLQLRRLGWLALFGYLHFALLWWGDILFLYAAAGALALAMRHMPRPAILIAAAIAYIAWQAHGVASYLPAARAELAVAQGTADAAQKALAEKLGEAWQGRIDEEMAHARMGFIDGARDRLTREPLEPVEGMMTSLGETLPYMLVGMLLFMSGFFAGGWSRARMLALAVAGIGLGAPVTIGFAGWALAHGYPHFAMIAAVNYALAFPHLLMALGYAALLMLAAPPLAATVPGRRLIAAGRMALSNYLATSVCMIALFNGWGLGLAGRLPYHTMPLFVLGAWALMLAWSPAWLARFRQGPLEWLWRSLTEGRTLPLRW